MNLQLLINRILADPDTLIKPSRLLTLEEINSNKYLTSAYYFNNTSIRLVTARHLIADEFTLSDGTVRKFPRVSRGIDISQYAFDFILQEARSLIFIQPQLDYAILSSLKDKRFLTFGDHIQIPFGISNFQSPRPNALSISSPFTYGKPILIVEGLRDCLDAQTIYPYTLAMQTAAIPSMVSEILSTLTSTLILAFDDDEPGRKALKRTHYNHNFTYLDFQYPSSFKDIGSLSELYLTDPSKYEFFRSFIGLQLQSLITY